MLARADEIEQWDIPVFPFMGRDVTARGIPSGVLVGSILRRVEERWISEDFPVRTRLDEIFQEEIIAAKSGNE